MPAKGGRTTQSTKPRLRRSCVTRILKALALASDALEIMGSCMSKHGTYPKAVLAEVRAAIGRTN
jgi:hypothetical protein